MAVIPATCSDDRFLVPCVQSEHYLVLQHTRKVDERITNVVAGLEVDAQIQKAVCAEVHTVQKSFQPASRRTMSTDMALDDVYGRAFLLAPTLSRIVTLPDADSLR